MIEKRKLLKYNSLASSCIEDKNMALKIQQNLNFVLNYVDSVDETFKKPIEKQIVYRQLGSIVLSCIEALAKTLIVSCKKRCLNRKCQDREKCGYKEFPNDRGSAGEALQYLFDVRLFYLAPDEFDKLKQLYELRNYIHVSKNISETAPSNRFNADFVNCTLDYYYAFIDQLNLIGNYFFNNNMCLKILDGDGIKFTKDENKAERQLFYFMKIVPIISALLHKAELNDNDRWMLKKINDPENVDFDGLIKHIKEMVYRHGIVCKTEKEYGESKKRFKKCLLKHITKEEYIKRINDEI